MKVLSGDPNTFLSAVEAADLLGVSERTVRRWIKKGELQAQKSGRSFLIDPVDARAARHRLLEVQRTQQVSELAVLRGRYLELKDTIERLEAELAAERRARAAAEARLHNRAA